MTVKQIKRAVRVDYMLKRYEQAVKQNNDRFTQVVKIKTK